MSDDLFQIVFMVGWVAYEALFVSHGRRLRRENRIADNRRMLGWEPPLAILAFLGMQVLPLIYILSTWLEGLDYHLPSGSGCLGAVLFAASLWITWRSHVDLGRNWSPTLQIREGHNLVTEGIYRYLRHPIYAGQWLWAIAQALLLQNWLVGLAGLITFAPIYFYRARYEEQMMIDHFGEVYRRYMARTGRIIPRFRGR